MSLNRKVIFRKIYFPKLIIYDPYLMSLLPLESPTNDDHLGHIG